MKRIFSIILVAILSMSIPLSISAQEEKSDQKTDNEETEESKEKDENKIPSHVLNISKENTYPNSTKDEVTLEPSDLVDRKSVV